MAMGLRIGFGKGIGSGWVREEIVERFGGVGRVERNHVAGFGDRGMGLGWRDLPAGGV